VAADAFASPFSVTRRRMPTEVSGVRKSWTKGTSVLGG
jgi:hypothetical protein